MNDTKILIESIQKWGNSASIALFDPVCKTFSSETIPGIIGYRIESGCAVAFGDPVCPPEERINFAQQFHEYCRTQNLEVIYVTVSPEFAESMKNNACILLSIGDEIILDPMRNVLEESGSNARLLRKKYNNALREGILVKEYTGGNPAFEQECQDLKNAWLAGRKGLQIYLSSVHLFADRENKRWFYAEKNGTLIGLLMLNRIGGCNGWVQNMLMLKPETPPSTSELLVLSALETLRTEDCRYYSVGAAPGNLTKIEGLGKFRTTLVRATFKIAKKMFNLTGRHKYWEKFSPRSKPTFMILPQGHLGIQEMAAIMRAFNVSF